jgi:uncharacterized membrane protein YidH (DUF202 family)
MRIGAALVLIAVGAILRFAIAISSTHGFNIQIIGDILMLVGILGLILWMVVWAPWTRGGRRTTYRPTRSVDGARYPQDYPPPGAPGSYRRDEVTTEDDYLR